MAVGGRIEQERADVSHYLEDMEVLADVMEAQGHWRRPQVLHLYWDKGDTFNFLSPSSPSCGTCTWT